MGDIKAGRWVKYCFNRFGQVLSVGDGSGWLDVQFYKGVWPYDIQKDGKCEVVPAKCCKVVCAPEHFEEVES